ncbi:membrane protein [Gordonia phage Lilbeanie]|uniref:Membrane protein n=1 Tax=Gordonia phage Lilbeanie TaxID=2794947 RepID=A0A7T1NWW6_9CAUD|nr:membrane protein [Gordonia phage Lilbeanie]QPO17090.1 membrane protein [Gordonia phage Lilbeanie]
MDVLTVILTIVAVARLTRLVVADAITYPIRARIVLWTGEESRLTYFVTCSWCVSIWLGAGVAAAAYWFADDRWWLYVVLALAASYVAGVANRWLDPA